MLVAMPTPHHRILVAEDEIAARIAALAREIAGDVPSTHPLVVGLLRGSFVFLADLVRELSRQGLDPEVELAWTSRYAADMRPAEELRVVQDVAAEIEGRTVLLVDDIVDTGETLAVMRERLLARRPSWLRTCVLLDKSSARSVQVPVDYRGFEVPGTWVFGYGLDHDGHGRGLPYLAERT